jgi:hypothetical protein
VRLCVNVPRAVRSQIFSPETVGLRPLAAFQFCLAVAFGRPGEQSA